MGQDGTSGFRPIQAQQMRERAVEAHVNVPIEQTWVWYEFEETFPGRELIGFFEVVVDGEPVALIALQRVEYHGFHFLWAKHGPVWLVPVNVELEKRVVEMLVAWAKKNAPLAPFIRLHLTEPVCGAQPPVQMITYDKTVVMETGGDAEQVMADFKKRTRTRLRQYLRRSPVEVRDETAAAVEDFGEFYQIMASTASRQGFNAWGPEVYQSMLRELGTEHARLLSASVDGERVAWAIFTLSGTGAEYLYAACTDRGREVGAPPQILLQAAVSLGEEGIEEMDLMGIGSELSPSLSHLNPFKTGFAKEETQVAPAWDVPVNKAAYKALIGARESARALRQLTGKLSERARELVHRK